MSLNISSRTTLLCYAGTFTTAFNSCKATQILFKEALSGTVSGTSEILTAVIITLVFPESFQAQFGEQTPQWTGQVAVATFWNISSSREAGGLQDGPMMAQETNQTVPKEPQQLRREHSVPQGPRQIPPRRLKMAS